MKERLTPSAQLLLWAYDRGSVPFDLLCFVLAVILFVVPARFWGDPLIGDVPVSQKTTGDRQAGR